MSYQIIPNIIFILSILGIILIILRHLPKAIEQQAQSVPDLPAEKKLLDKGLPAIAVSKVRAMFKLALAKAWNFLLEAKDLKPGTVAGYKIKKIFKGKFPQVHKHGAAPASAVPQAVKDVKDEKFFLDAIKNDPKNLSNYDALGKFYLDNSAFSDAKDIYLYLTSHNPASSDYHSRLAQCFYKLGQYNKAAEHYQKSLTLDSTQPNRYYNLGLCFEALGNFQEAIKNFEQAIAIEPKNNKYQTALSNAYSKTGDQQKALMVLQQFKKSAQPEEKARQV